MAGRSAKQAAAVEAARQRRSARAAEAAYRLEWFADEVQQMVGLSLKRRMRLAVNYLQSKVVRNISVPVRKEVSERTGRIVVTERSKAGEFPRADTTLLMKSIFSDVREEGGSVVGYVGTPLDYGLFLETKMNRSFLVRTLIEERGILAKLLGGSLDIETA